MWAYGFRFYFTPLPGCFSPFPHGTSALSVAKEYLALEGGPPGFPRDSSCPVVLGVLPESFRPFRIRGSYPLWPDVPVLFSYSLRFRRASATAPGSPATPYAQRLQPSTCIRFGLFPLRSPLLGESRLLSLPRGTKMFQFPRFAPCTYGFSTGYLDITPGGLPHSGIPGSTPACGSPRLFAAYHALLRLLAPRHPPYALTSLTIFLRWVPYDASSLCSFQRTTWWR